MIVNLLNNNHSYSIQKIKKINEWVPGKLFSITITKDKNFFFKAGQFTRIGVGINNDTNNIIWRAYSMVNSPNEDYLEFYYVIVPNGKFSRILSKLKFDQTLFVRRQSFGFLTIDQFQKNTDNLWLMATGTGISSYISILKDKKTWDRFKKIILVHSVREIKELTYQEIINKIKIEQSTIGNILTYVPITTKENTECVLHERLPIIIENKRLEEMAKETLDCRCSSVMLCGNPEMLLDVRKILIEKGFTTKNSDNSKNLVMENYW
ncbi:ferredoxin--NADP+ reductase [Candidatus Kinetoplastibacterium blastocrithidii TCC012E]|uniref:ferredoxin--NADP(+) reductase n=1 Tax=Candidatus Kinetoplastidibacterium blastocrithidiae TCC012E TaxID=1208922 RepID=M1MDV2_9PROT|nr:ferredoxin--NADP reductase [Candidatus Kinetoplastibacterium blastocrithidii]AFZ83780.1 ferredoxin--NADP reductase [Candidatus Kinetoplastibacterium blastocrithidii (ex Strigomonas culicis)]AGF49905.1 ferredoxin--NADP+ reductase [Candidatus Kinetoplastibacterium blastocrithidii TCC012E]